MKLAQRSLWTVSMSFGLLIAAGCGEVKQEYSQQEIQVISPTDNVRSWLQGLSSSGELDSGADSIRDVLGTLDVPEQAKLSQEYESLLKLRNPGRIRAKANDMLKLLPSEN